MRNKAARSTLIRLLENARYEVLPTPSAEDTLLEHVPRNRTITVTASPSKGLASTFELAERLTGHGYDVVPHVAARMVANRSELTEIADRLTGKGITSIFVPGGDAEAVGDYADALTMLEDLAAIGSPFQHVGVTGYPESHPTISDDLTVQSMWDKRRYATHIVSNLTFDPASVRDWVRRLRSRGITMPLLVGVPGPVERDQAARHGHPDRGRGVDPVPGQAQGHVRQAGRPGRLHRPAVPRAVRPRAGRAGQPRRGPARLHLQPDPGHRGLAHRGAGAAASLEPGCLHFSGG